MMDAPMHARLVNAGGELIVEGPCWLDERAGTATLEPEREPGAIQKERGALRLELETGRTLRVSDRPIVFRLRQGQPGPQPAPSSEVPLRTLYRLRLLKDGSLEPQASLQPEPVGYRAGAAARTNGHW